MSHRAARELPDLYCRAAGSRARCASCCRSEDKPSPECRRHRTPSIGAGWGDFVGFHPFCSRQRTGKFQRKRFRAGQQRVRTHPLRALWDASNRRQQNNRDPQCDQCPAPYHLPAPTRLGNVRRQPHRLALSPVDRSRRSCGNTAACQLHGR